MNPGSKWRDLSIAAAVATLLEFTPVSDAFYRYVYLPVFQEPAQGTMLEVVQVAGWCFYWLIFWLALQLISFLFGNPSSA
jgi:hypothetical protein